MTLTRSSYDSRSIGLVGGFSCVLTESSGVVRMTLSGELDIATAPELAAALSTAANDAMLVIVDLSGLTFMDSSGAHAILTARDRFREPDCRLVLIPGPRQVQHVFEITGIEDRFEYVSDTRGLASTRRSLALGSTRGTWRPTHPTPARPECV